MEENASQPPSLEIIEELEYSMWKATVLKTALELELFTVVAQGHHALGDIAVAAGCDERGMRKLLDALCPLGLLNKMGEEYALTPVSEAYLVRGKPAYYGDFSLGVEIAWETRGRAAEAVRTGLPVGGRFEGPEAESLWASGQAPAILNWPGRAAQARQMWESVGVGRDTRPGARILDVACGAGVKSFVLAQSDPEAHVTALDLPGVLEVAGRVAEAMGVAGQVTFLPGEILSADLGSEQFDIILFGSVLYFFGREAREGVLRRAFGALKPGGLVVINETLADEERCREELALIMAFELHSFVPEGDAYTFSEYREMLERLGFTGVKQYSNRLAGARKFAS